MRLLEQSNSDYYRSREIICVEQTRITSKTVHNIVKTDNFPFSFHFHRYNQMVGSCISQPAAELVLFLFKWVGKFDNYIMHIKLYGCTRAVVRFFGMKGKLVE